MFQKWFRCVALWIMAGVAGVLAGCGDSSVGSVNGTVTLDGQPLPDAMVQFQPVAGKAPSTGTTDDSGQYSLRYTRELDGAEVGEHTVRITTFTKGNPDADPPRPRAAEKVPAKYNSKSELKASVKSGSNNLDFPLVSDGPISQPKN